MTIESFQVSGESPDSSEKFIERPYVISQAQHISLGQDSDLKPFKLDRQYSRLIG